MWGVGGWQKGAEGRCESYGTRLRDALIEDAANFVGVQLSVGVEIKGDARGDWLDGLRIDVANGCNHGARLVGRLDGVAAGSKEGLHCGVRGANGQVLLEHFLDGFELRVRGLTGLLPLAARRKSCKGDERDEKKNRGNRLFVLLAEKWHRMVTVALRYSTISKRYSSMTGLAKTSLEMRSS